MSGDVNLSITGDDTGLVATLDQAAAAVTEKVGQMKETFAGIGEGLNGLIEGFGAFAAIFAGGEIANQLSEIAERAEQIKLSAQTFNLSTTALQGLQAAAAQTGVSSETLNTAMTSLQSRMSQAAETGGSSAARFEALGITLEQMRDPSFSVIDALTQMGDASNSNAALMAVLGARGAELIPLMRELAENHQLVAQSAQQVGALLPGEIQALDNYKEGVATLGIEFDNLKGRVGAYVVTASGPLVDALKAAASGFGETVDMTIPLKAAFGTVEAAVIVVVGAFKTLKDVAVDSVRETVDTVAGLGTVIEDVFTGKWSKVEGDAKTAFSIIKDDGVSAFKDLGSNVEATVSGVMQSYKAAFSSAAATPVTPPAGAAGQNALVDLSGQKSAADEMADMYGQIAQKVRQSFSAAFGEIDADAAASVKSRETLETGSADRQIAAVANAYKSGQITAQQDLAETQQLLNEKWQEQQDYYNKLRSLYAGDQAELDRLDAQEAKDYQTHLTQLQTSQQTYSSTVQRSWASVAQGMSSSMSQAFTGILTGTETVTQGMSNLFKSMGEKIIQTLVQIEVQKAVMSALGIAQNKTEAHSDAAAAAAGAAKSAAQIPLIGWILAPVAAATVYAIASGFSAESGFDIPAGLNPKTQLHEREMVLPQKYADVIRGMGDEDGGGSAGVHLHVHATDSDSVERLFSRNGDALAKTLRQLHRDGKLTSR